MSCTDITQEDWQYVIKQAVEWFNKNQEESIDWRLGRKAIKGEERENERNRTMKYIIENIEKINKYNEEKEKIKYFIGLLILIQNNHLQNYDTEKDILLFLISWNIQRFINILNEKNINKWLDAIKNAINICQNSNNNDKEIFKEVFNQYKSITGDQERVITAKTLFVINPDRFIAWDKQIINLFFCNHTSDSIENMYESFNSAVGCIISKYDLENYLNDKYRSYEYSSRKLLDMILYIFANCKINDYQFLYISCKIIAEIRNFIQNSENGIYNNFIV